MVNSVHRERVLEEGLCQPGPRESRRRGTSGWEAQSAMMKSVDNQGFLHALCGLRPRITALRLKALLSAAGSPETAWNAEEATLQRAGWSDEAIAFFVHHRQQWDVSAEADRLLRSGITLVPLESKAYPVLLRELYDPPIGLYARGDLQSARSPTVAVVGSRKATPYGRTATNALVRPLAARGLTVVSGLAYGVDAEAHRATLAVHGHTIAVLGSGIDDASLYPRAHRGLAAEIVGEGGALVSEFPPGTGARAEFFPQRNRIIAGLSRAVIIVEAAAGSGALITARLALAENREVFAVPGPITSPLSEGTNRLLREGAAPALSADDILEALALEEMLAVGNGRSRTAERNQKEPTEQASLPSLVPPSGGAPLGHPYGSRSDPKGTPALGTPGGSSADQLLSTIGLEPQHIDAVLASSTLPPHEVTAALSLLELEGRVRDVGGKHYVRC